MKKSIAIFDVDKTIFPGYSILDFAKYLFSESMFDRGEWIEFEKIVGRYKEGTLRYNEFAKLIVNSYARGLSGKSVEKVAEKSKLFWDKRMTTIFGYFMPLLEKLHRNSVEIIVISGSPTESLLPMVKKLGIKQYYCTEIGIENGKYLSYVEKNTADHDGKMKTIKEIFKKILPECETYGFGDSVADLAFLELVDKPFVIGNHDNDLAEVAKREGWRVILDPNNERIEL